MCYNQNVVKTTSERIIMERYKVFTLVIANLTRSIRKIKTAEMAKWNLKSQHVSCIYYLYEKGVLTATQLCEICGEDKANMSRSIEYLEENGYIVRREHANHRYNTHYTLTETGLAVGRSIFERVENIITSASDGLSDEDRNIMYSSLSTIDGNLKKIADEY